MEFKSLTNIESSFRRIRLMLAVFVGCCTLVTVFALWNSYRFAEKLRESNVTERSLVTDCQLQNTSRSDDNPNGFIIEHLTILENKDIRSVER